MKFIILKFLRGRLSQLIFVLILCSQIVGISMAADIASSSFLRMGVDARGAAMAGAQGASTESVYSMYWNPAGLADVLFHEVGVTYYRIYQDMHYSFVGYAAPAMPYGTLAIQAFFLNSGSIKSTYENADGSFAGTGDTFSVSDMGLGISQSRKIGRDFSYGVNLKLLGHKIKSEQAFALAIDAGFLFQTVMDEFKTGLVIQNLSNKYSFIKEELREPWGVKLATVYRFLDRPLVLTGDYNIIRERQDTLNIGSEYWFYDMLAFRAGMRLPSPAGFLSVFSLGFGINWRDLYQLDYSFSPHTELGINQRFSLIVRF